MTLAARIMHAPLAPIIAGIWHKGRGLYMTPPTMRRLLEIAGKVR